MIPSKQLPTYRLKDGSIYKETWRGPAGNDKNGIPTNPGTDIVNLVKTSGKGPDLIVLSAFDLSVRIEEVDLITSTNPTKAPGTTKITEAEARQPNPYTKKGK